MVSAAPAHIHEAAAELVPAGSDGATAGRGPDRRRSFRTRVTHNFAWFTAAVAALFAVAAGTGMVLSGTDVGIVAALETGGRQSEIGIVFLFWCAASVVGGLIYGAMHRPVSPMLLLLGMAALTIPMGFASDTWTLALVAILPGLLCAPVLTAGVALGAPLAGCSSTAADPPAGSRPWAWPGWRCAWRG